MAADLVDKMPSEGNPARSKYNDVAQDICAVAYAGEYSDEEVVV